MKKTLSIMILVVMFIVAFVGGYFVVNQKPDLTEEEIVELYCESEGEQFVQYLGADETGFYYESVSKLYGPMTGWVDGHYATVTTYEQLGYGY